MRFCPECGSIMTKSPYAATGIIFQCRCQLMIQGSADDSLMLEEYIDGQNIYQKHVIFIENAPFDPAGHILHKDCPNCKLNFLTMVQIGDNATTVYTCSCGFVSSLEEYNKLISKK